MLDKGYSGMRILVFGLVVFFFTHSMGIFSKTRAFFLKNLGEDYLKRYTMVGALIGLIAIIYGFGAYRAGGYIDVWYPPVWTRHLAASLMLFSIILMVSAFIPSFIKTKAKHPMLASVKIWALSHLIANGDLGSMVLFGSFLIWAVASRISMKYREPALKIAQVPVSHVPFGQSDVRVLLIGVGVYLATAMFLHKWLIGVAVFSR
jgi:uncharacterized membrane protein